MDHQTFAQLLGNYGEFVGAIAVVATLIYLARQVRDGSRQIRLNTTSNLATLSQESFSAIYFSPSNQELWHTGRDNPEKLTDEQFQQFATYMDRIFYAFQLLVTYHDVGAIEEDLFRTQGSYYRYLFNTPGGRKWWAQTPMQFSESARHHLGRDDDSL